VHIAYTIEKVRVVVLRGNLVNPWDLTPWEKLGPAYEVQVLVPPNNLFDAGSLALERVPVETVGGKLPRGIVGAVGTKAVGEHYLGLEEHLRGADIVDSSELGYWFTAQAAALRERLGFRLAVHTWETLPFLRAYRNIRTRPYREAVLQEADLFLPRTERARDALLVEGAPADRIRLCPPGIDVQRFATARVPNPPADGTHLVISIARLVWEKGHQDLLRALALLRQRGRTDVRALIVGVGPEEKRLRRVIADLELEDIVELKGWVPYDELPAVYARASCLVLGSMPTRFWEEQFGLVLAEAMAGHVPVVAAASGAIPEVVGESATLFSPGDWVGLADVLERGPLAREPGARREPEPDRLERFSVGAMASRLSAIYDELMGVPRRPPRERVTPRRFVPRPVPAATRRFARSPREPGSALASQAAAAPSQRTANGAGRPPESSEDARARTPREDDRTPPRSPGRFQRPSSPR
jgi:glycosyltransferase involved in cell wall biosynthesis